MGTSRGSQQNAQQDRMLGQSDTAIQNAAAVNPLYQREQANLTKFDDQWNNGTDVSQMDYVRPFYNLYNNQVNSDQQGNVGQGLLGNNQLTGSNGNLSGLIGQQLAARNKQQASGDLYNSVIGAKQYADQQANTVAAADTAQRMGVAGLYTDRYNNFVHRPQQQPFWQQLVLGGVRAGGQIGAAYAGS